MWLVFVVINMLISGFLDIIEKKGSSNQPLHFWAIAVLLYGIFNVLLGFILSPSVLLDFSFKTLFLTFPISFLSTVGYYCTVNAFKYSTISQVSPILRAKIVWVLILSTIFINDKLSFLQIFLIFALLSLNILLNVDNKTKGAKKGMLYALGFLLTNGTATFINKVVITAIPDPVSITFYTGVTSILSIFIMLVFTNNLKLLNFKDFKNKKYVIAMELLEVVAGLLLRYALIDGNVVIITAMTSSSVILAIILSRILFKEKISVGKWLIISLIVIALVILSVISI